MNVITLTLNPAIDKTLELKGFEKGRLNKVIASHSDPGGKGINVSKTVLALGGQTTALGFCGGKSGAFIEEALTTMGIACDFTPVQGESRTNTKIVDLESGDLTEVNEAGPYVDPTGLEAQQLLQTYGEHLNKASVVVLSGSAPRGLSPDFYGKLIDLAKSKHVPTILDADGEYFLVGLKAMPTLIKPNSHELTAYFKRDFAHDFDYYEAACHFLSLGIVHVFISRGAQGAFYANAGGFYKLGPLKIDAHSPVGAGDAFVGACAFALANNLSTDYMMRLALATSAGAVVTPGTKAPRKDWIEAHIGQVIIEKGECDENQSRTLIWNR